MHLPQGVTTCSKKKVIISVIYRCPSQSNDDLDSFISNFQHLLSNINKRKPSLFVISGDFNAKFSSWWSNDISTIEGSKLYTLTSTKGFDQLIDEPTRIQTKSSSRIDLMFTDQQNLSINSGVYASLCTNCH